MSKFSLYDIFTPGKPATHTFVSRGDVEDKLVRNLRIPGRQIVVYGHSGSGKTTLLHNKLHQTYEWHLTTRCSNAMTFESIVLDAFDQLDPFYSAERSTTLARRVDANLQNAFLGIKAQIGAQRTEKAANKELRALPPQLTPQRLAAFIGASGACWVLEDFHKVKEADKAHLADTMKIFVDMAVDYPDLKIIALGAVNTAREVVAYDTNMSGRVAEIFVDLMSDDQLRDILRLGERKLNVMFSTDIKDSIIHYSNNLAMVCHQLALNACDSHGVEGTVLHSPIPEPINDTDLTTAIRTYLEDESDTLKKVFDKAARRKKTGKYDNCRTILECISMSADGGLTHAEILKKVRKEYPDYPAGNVTYYLRQLQEDDRSCIIRLDAASGRFDFSNPLHKAYARLALGVENDSGQYIPADIFDQIIRDLRDRWVRSDRDQPDLPLF